MSFKFNKNNNQFIRKNKFMRTFISALALTLILLFVSSSQPSKKINSIELWRSQNLPRDLGVKQQIYGKYFFPEVSQDGRYGGRIGLSAKVVDDPFELNPALQHFIETISDSSGGYILGRRDRFSYRPLNDHFVQPVKYNAFFHGNGVAQKYTIWLHMKKMSNMPQPEDDLITLHVRNYNGDDNFDQYWHHSYTCEDMDVGELAVNGWYWYRFDIDTLLNEADKEFALEWHGGNGDGMVRISHIAYTTEFYTYLFPDTSDVPSGAGWDEFLKLIDTEFELGAKLIGWSAYESYRYSWETVKIISNSLRERYGSRVGFIYSQEPSALTRE